ncbi:MAG: insulinase family protein [Candidatus Calescibacterium sp.]|nr:insulinase family protein [Candidatus Calescibacterium sp.]MCX7972797.1 insulinase family protein [bacterium]MDW8195871.1 insulinase family protein [Candidatus Calescibacterium sp.]
MVKYVLFLFFSLIFSYCYDIKEFDRAWERFLYSDVFVMKTNSYVTSLNVIYPLGLVDENRNKVGIRYVFFYSLSKKIEQELTNNDLFCKVRLEVSNDYVHLKISIPYNYDLLRILNLLKNYMDFGSFELDRDLLEFLEVEVRDYYSQSLNSILFYFRQNVFSSHPYSFLSFGNPKNYRHFDVKDLEDFIKGRGIVYYFLVLLDKTKDDSEVYRYIVRNFKKNSNDYPKRLYSLASFTGERYYYRKVDIVKTRTFTFNIKSEASYFLYIFTAPEFYKNFDEYICMLIIDNLLNDTMDGIIWRELRQRRGLVYSIYSEYPLLRWTSYYVIFTSCYHTKQGEVKRIMNKIIENHFLNDEEIMYSKQKLYERTSLGFISSEMLADNLVQALIYKDKRITPFYLKNYIFSVTEDQVRNVYKKYFMNYYLFIFQGG